MTGLAGLLIAALGGSGVALLAIALTAIKNPDKIQIWLTWMWRGARLVTKKAEYAYIGQDVTAQVNAHLGRDLSDQIDGFPSPRIQIQWDNSAEAVASEVAGTLIVRMRPHEDRTANLLHAALAATPRLVIPTLRSELGPVQASGIDLQLCRRFAESISKTAITRYRLDILDPALGRIPGLAEMLERLQSADLGGLFIPVFLQELTKIGTQFPVDRLPNLSAEVDDFLTFLINVAEREPGEDVHLTFVGSYFRVSIMLVARRQTRAKGIAPYRWRVTAELAKGVDTIYVLATDANLTFADEVAGALDADRRLICQRRKKLRIQRGGRAVEAIIIPFERNAGFATGEYFRDVLQAAQIRPGKRILATVIDVQDNYATIDVSGVAGVIRPPDLAWGWVHDCRNQVAIGDEIEVEVLGVNSDGLEIQASRKACLPNPLASIVDADVVGKTMQMHVTAHVDGAGGRSSFVSGVSVPEGLPMRLAADELDWGTDQGFLLESTVGADCDVLVIKTARDAGCLYVSRKRLAGDVWRTIREKYPRDRNLIVMVHTVDQSGAYCEVEPGLTGFVPADEFRQAGFEYVDFESTLRPGQALRVFVRNVVAGTRQRLTLGLQINRARRA